MSANSQRLASGLSLAGAIAVIAVVIVLENFGGGSLNRVLLHLPGVDKPLHVAQSFLIALFMFVIAGRLRLEQSARLAIAVGAAVVLALFDEWQQRWFGERTIEAADVVAGLAGIALAAAGTQFRRSPRFAIAVATIAAVVAAVVTVNSYRLTRDFNRGLLAEERGDLAAAFRHFSAAKAAGIRSPGLYNSLAWSALESGAGPVSEAVENAAEAVRLNPTDADILDTYGWALQKTGRSAEALVPLEQALAKDPQMYCIHYHLGAAYFSVGDVDSAVRHLRRQVESQPDTKEANMAAELLRQIGRSD